MDHASRRFLAFVENGDLELLDDLLREFRDDSVRRAQSLLGNATDTEDAVQDAILRLIDTADSYDGRIPFGAWLGRLVLDACASSRRRELRSRRHTHQFDGLDDGPPGVEAATGPEGIDALRRAIKELPDLMREPLELRYFCNLSQREIAERLRVKEGLVAVRIHRAKQRLRNVLAQGGLSVGLAVLTERLCAAGEAGPAGRPSLDPATSRPRIASSGWRAWIGLVCAPVAVIGVWWLLGSHGGTPIASAAALGGTTTSPAPVRSHRQMRWRFDRPDADLTVVSGRWHHRADGGMDDGGCMETDTDLVRIRLPIASLRLPLRMDVRLGSIAPSDDIQVTMGWDSTRAQYQFGNVGVPKTTIPSDPRNPTFQQVFQFSTADTLDCWSSYGRSALNVIEGPNEDAELLVKGRVRLDDLVIREIDQSEVPDVDAFRKAVFAVPERERHGATTLTGVVGADPGRPVIIYWGR
jgi:RNA polymerase sigma factor (sigma-70 family)